MKQKVLKIAFFDSKPYDITSFEKQNKNFNYSIKFFESHLNADTVKMTEGFDVVCVFVNDQVDKHVIRILTKNNIKLLTLRCAGYNNVDLQAIFNAIPVVRVPAYSPNAVAEHAIALIMTLNRKTHKAYNRVREGNFSINGLLGFDLNSKTAGIIGTGKIGQVLIKILVGFGMKVIAYDPYPDDLLAKELQFEFVDLNTLFQASDIISLHCPLNDSTHHLINEETIAKMKTGVMLINTSRGPLVKTTDLIQALKNGKIGAAGLDVYEEESDYFFEDKSNEILNDDQLARLLTFNNVIVTSHQGFFTQEALANISETTLNNIKLFFEQDKLPNEICYKCGTVPCPKIKNKSKRCFDLVNK